MTKTKNKACRKSWVADEEIRTWSDIIRTQLTQRVFSFRRTYNVLHRGWRETLMPAGDSQHGFERFLSARNQRRMWTTAYLLFTMHRWTTWYSQEEPSVANQCTLVWSYHSNRCWTLVRHSLTIALQGTTSFDQFGVDQSIRTLILNQSSTQVFWQMFGNDVSDIVCCSPCWMHSMRYMSSIVLSENIRLARAQIRRKSYLPLGFQFR